MRNRKGLLSPIKKPAVLSYPIILLTYNLIIFVSRNSIFIFLNQIPFWNGEEELLLLLRKVFHELLPSRRAKGKSCGHQSWQDYACRYGQARTVKRRFTSAIFGVFKSPNAEENASVSVKKEVCDKVNLALGGHI